MRPRPGSIIPTSLRTDARKFTALNNGETIDLSGYMNSYQNLIVVVGNGDQTDAEHNVRYELTVYTYEGSEYSLWMNFNYSYDVLSEPAYFEDVLGMQGYELGFPLSSEREQLQS